MSSCQNGAVTFSVRIISIRGLLYYRSIVSCIGAFGSYKYAYEINGTANIRAAKAANDNGVERFVFISAKQYEYIESVPPMNGYFQGKRAAEEEIQKLFPSRSTILRPGMVYGVCIYQPPNY